ncbi:alkaline phosphatase [Alkanindiges hydrocarboniclasticus]|jgi:membrane protein DedA with SNARE-associated domain|uniref:Alkaline phosphatase n=1 Tax=Alkanindiges hydrocarboniclasticus TaxID=1907941 RepID=A0A1S8CXV2_9GAMM|nr:DedA family protein [Alkanindiges hydrocarboniclasticus]ONG41876.1 alkaline phosphatase [Alkanindiges hydrocarboniclasticus]
MSSIAQWINEVMQQLGYFGIALLMFLDNIFPPIPSELIMPAAGFTASQGDLNIIGVIIAGSCGSILAAITLYWIGRILHEDRLTTWLEHHGKWLFLKPDDLKKATGWFNQHGRKIVFFGRMVPAVRSVISIPAGIARMPFGLFLLYTSMGTIIWTSILALAGYYLGNNVEKFSHWLSGIGNVIVVVLLLAAGFAIRRYYKHKGQSDKQESKKASA